MAAADHGGQLVPAARSGRGGRDRRAGCARSRLRSDPADRARFDRTGALSRSWIAAFWSVGLVALLAWRAGLHLLATRWTREGKFRRRTVSFIFQTFNLFPALTALENVEFGADVSGRGQARAVAEETLERVGLGGRGAHFPHELSGGEQQRVAIARALATRNPILLADEPTGELDFRTGVQILELLHEQTHTEDTAVLVVTHNREIARVAHRVIELSSGRVVADGPNPGGPAEISELHW